MPDFFGKLRYGVDTAEKEKLARQRALPGAPLDTSAEQEKADRYASGYLFGKTWPILSRLAQPMVDRLKTSDLPLLGGSTPELQSQASSGVMQGRLAAENQQQQGDSVMANPWDDPSLANDATKKIKKRTEELKLNPLKPSTPAKKAAPGLSKLSDAYSQAEKFERRNRKVEEATRPLRKSIPGQGE
jgi:hypothetical protein